MPNKRYFLFAGVDYYPEGGAYDFMGSYETLEAARAAKPDDYRAEWAQIAYLTDGGTLEIVETFDYRALACRIEGTRGDGVPFVKHHFGPLWTPK